MIRPLYLLFFISGAAGLLYESVWARYLGLFVGHEAYAQVLVLVIFLGGMALGAALVARRADSIRNPLLMYALVEAVAGIFGLVFHDIFVASTSWAQQVGLGVAGPGVGAAVLKWTLASLLILPPSALLGTTFPLMSAGVLRLQPESPGRVLGWLYFSNSFGASIGVLLAGFGLVALWGLPGVTRSAGLLNLFVAISVIALTRRAEIASVPRRVKTQEPIGEKAETGSLERIGQWNSLERVLLATAFLTAVASFSYEIGWIRMLSLLLGSATHSFELILSAFIFGLALGSLIIRRRADTLRFPLLALAWIQVVMGVLAIATLPIYGEAFGWMQWLLGALAPTESGYATYNVARYALCLLIMLPATVCAGMTLPLITRILLLDRRSESAVGAVYASNTVGAIVGVALAALVVLPLIGVKGVVVFGGLTDMVVGFALMVRFGYIRSRVLPVMGAASVALAIAVVPLDRRVLVSGVFRGQVNLDAVQESHLDYYADGRTASIAVVRTPGGFLSLSTNGKTDASRSPEAQRSCDPLTPRRQVDGDETTQILTGLIPLGYVARPGDAVMIGMGSGVSTHVLLASPLVSRVTTVEIEPRVFDAARLFAPANARAFDDSRSHQVLGDARTYFATMPGRAELIVSEPSNPWVSGVSTLFTVEFYRQVASRLSDTGVFVQWLQTYELDDESVLWVLRAVDEVFGNWRIHQAGESDILIVASKREQLPAPDWARVLELPALTHDLCGILPIDSTILDATVITDRSVMSYALAGVAVTNSDFFPRLDLRAERRRFQQHSAGGVLTLGDDWFNHARFLANQRALPAESRGIPFQGMRRSQERYLRTWQESDAPSQHIPDGIAADVSFAWRKWHQGLESRTAPPWRAWLDDFREVTAVRHAGTAGWTDSAYFARAEAFALRHNAPGVVHDVIAFREAVTAWNASAVMELGERLADSTRTGWIPARDVVDAVVIAAYSRNRPDVVRAWLKRFASLDDRSADDLRSRILAGLEKHR